MVEKEKRMKKKHRSCIDCMGYCNLLDGSEYRCGLGFLVEERIEGGDGKWEVVVQPKNDGCSEIRLPKTREEFVITAASLGIEWDIDDVWTVKEYNSSLW